MARSLKFVLFIVGIIGTLASAIGLAVSFGFTPGILASMPADARIYFGITLLCGLVALVSSFSRTWY